MNYFGKDLQWSNSPEVRDFWKGVYRAHFPELESIQIVDDKKQQAKGVDILCRMKSGKIVKVEEKIRRKQWDDILLEVWSDYEQRILGWGVKEQEADLLAYGFIQTGVAYFFDRQKLTEAFLANGKAWSKEFGTRSAPNKGYHTISIPVPIARLQQVMGEAMNRSSPAPSGRAL